MASPSTLWIEGDGIALRPFTLDDVAAVTEACQDQEIVKWTVAIPSPYEEAHARAWIEAHDDMRRDNVGYPFAIVDEDDRLLGNISLISPGTVGYWVAAWARNRGVATEALLLLSDWAFTEFPLDRLALVTLLGNTASERVAQKAGFELVEETDAFEHPGAPGRTFRAKRWIRKAGREPRS